MLKAHRNPDETILNDHRKPRVLVTEAGGPLAQVALKSGGVLRKSDNVQSAYRRLTERLKLTNPKPLKLLRKTSASLLGLHPHHKYFTQYFLAHSPRSVAERHYIKPNATEFAESLAWLRQQYGFDAVDS